MTGGIVALLLLASVALGVAVVRRRWELAPLCWKRMPLASCAVRMTSYEDGFPGDPHTRHVVVCRYRSEGWTEPHEQLVQLTSRAHARRLVGGLEQGHPVAWQHPSDAARTIVVMSTLWSDVLFFVGFALAMAAGLFVGLDPLVAWLEPLVRVLVGG